MLRSKFRLRKMPMARCEKSFVGRIGIACPVSCKNLISIFSITKPDRKPQKPSPHYKHVIVTGAIQVRHVFMDFNKS